METEKQAIDTALLLCEAQRIVVSRLLCRTLIDSGAAKHTEKSLAAEVDLKSEVAPLINIIGRIGEDRICAMFDHLIMDQSHFPQLHPGVVEIHREFQLPCGRADRVLKHADGSFTVVEIKPAGSRRDQAHGLGQVILYASSMRASLNSSADIRAALVVGASHDKEISEACNSAGVEYIAISQFEQRLIEKLAAIYNESYVLP